MNISINEFGARGQETPPTKHLLCGRDVHVPRFALLLLIALNVAAAMAEAPAGMALIPDGIYKPLFKNEPQVTVPSFYLDIYPVSNADFLEFVRANPEWRRSKIKQIFSDAAYLRHWADDLDLGPEAEKIKNSPVTQVSWFAARAYAAWKGKRLPTLAEWEYVAASGEFEPIGENEKDFLQRILVWYERPAPQTLPPVGSTFKNYYGVYDMHGLVWEWVADFNTALVTGESRGDTGLERSLFCGSGAIGASTFRDYAAFMRYALRSSLQANYTMANLGFRCAKDVEQEKSHSCCKPVEPSEQAIPNDSIFQLSSVWQNQSGEILQLDQLRGQIIVMAMFYSSCLYACPRIVADLKNIEAQLESSDRSSVRFVLASFDAERDRPEVLKAFAEKSDFDLSRWTLLHGDENSVRELAAVLNVRYRKEEGGHFAHANIIHILDENGVLLHQQEGLGADSSNTVAVIKNALEKEE